MYPPVLLLRDTLVAALLLSGAGFATAALGGGVETGIAVAAGGAAAVLNLWLLVRAVSGAAARSLSGALLPMKVPIALLIVAVLLTNFPLLPALVGLSAGLFGVLARGVIAVRHFPPSPAGSQ